MIKNVEYNEENQIIQQEKEQLLLEEEIKFTNQQNLIQERIDDQSNTTNSETAPKTPKKGLTEIKVIKSDNKKPDQKFSSKKQLKSISSNFEKENLTKEKLDSLLLISRNSLNEDNLLMGLQDSYDDDLSNSENFINFDESDLIGNLNSNSEICIEETKNELHFQNSNFGKKNNYKKESIYMQMNNSPKINNFLGKVAQEKSVGEFNRHFNDNKLKESNLMYDNESGSEWMDFKMESFEDSDSVSCYLKDLYNKLIREQRHSQFICK